MLFVYHDEPSPEPGSTIMTFQADILAAFVDLVIAAPKTGPGVAAPPGRQQSVVRCLMAVGHRCPAPPSTSAAICSRIRYFCTLPVTVIGNSVTKRMTRGIFW